MGGETELLCLPTLQIIQEVFERTESIVVDEPLDDGRRGRNVGEHLDQQLGIDVVDAPR
jgi:hypothetical protein